MHGGLPLLTICGTRPEIVKLAPVVSALRRQGQRVVLINTGQHRDLAPRMLQELGMGADHLLGPYAEGAPPLQILSEMLARLGPLFHAYKPPLAIVQGDTVSTIGGALAAAYAGVPIAHVEAGLRTHDLAEPFPEEMQRKIVAPIASLHFAPTRLAANALLQEGVPSNRIHITGNSGIDTLMATLKRLQQDGLADALASNYRFVAEHRRPLLLVTLHRRENIGPRLLAAAKALTILAEEDDIDILLPLHPNPAVHAPIRQRLGALPNVHLVPPVDHATMVWFMRHSSLLLTDSGGLQEEAPCLGLRTIVMRQNTERPEAIEAGASELVEPRQQLIVDAVRAALRREPMAAVYPFGDGRASERIAAIIRQFLGSGPALSNGKANSGFSRSH